MRTIMFGLLLAITLAAAAPARAAGIQTVGCSDQGYIMFVPSDWTVTDQCGHIATMKGPGGVPQLVNTVEKHGYWNDDRSRASIKGDIKKLRAAVSGTIGSQTVWRVNLINGRHFLAGLVQINFSDGTQAYIIEQEAFYAGYMYKFTAFTHLSDTDVKLTGTIWGTIHLLKHP